MDTLETIPTFMPFSLEISAMVFTGLNSGSSPTTRDLGFHAGSHGRRRGGGPGDKPVKSMGGGDAVGRKSVDNQLFTGELLGGGLLGDSHSIADEQEHILGSVSRQNRGPKPDTRRVRAASRPIETIQPHFLHLAILCISILLEVVFQFWINSASTDGPR